MYVCSRETRSWEVKITRAPVPSVQRTHWQLLQHITLFPFLIMTYSLVTLSGTGQITSCFLLTPVLSHFNTIHLQLYTFTWSTIVHSIIILLLLSEKTQCCQGDTAAAADMGNFYLTHILQWSTEVLQSSYNYTCVCVYTVQQYYQTVNSYMYMPPSSWSLCALDTTCM